MSAPSIPVLDLSQASAEKLGVSEAIKGLGFLALKSPEEPTAVQVSEIFRISQQFFENESVAEKERCQITVENKGWVKKRQESLDTSGYPGGDNKEAFNIASFTSANEPSQPLPSLLQEHTQELGDFIKSCHALGMRLLEAFALDMGLPSDYFTTRHAVGRKDSSILRLLYYPPTQGGSPVDVATPAGDIRAGAHSDYGTLTLLFQNGVGGLQILLPKTSDHDESRWLDAPVIPESVLVNIGDAFDFWTGGRFPSTQHRVVAPRDSTEAVARFSIAYFLHPSDDELLERIPQSIDTREDDSSVIKRFGIDPSTKLTAKEWLLQRLNPTYTGRKSAA